MARFIPWALVGAVLVAAALLWRGNAEAPLSGTGAPDVVTEAAEPETRSAAGRRGVPDRAESAESSTGGSGVRQDVGTTARTTVRGRVVAAR
ncbi:MAG: hypothetical protein O3B85_16045, partial [Planctomycetota bacterium]|nr:hypothetical protein [Planctomycetota bacterium]